MSNLVLVDNIVYQKSNRKEGENHNRYKSHYEVLIEVDLSQCNRFAKQLSKCKEAYLVRIGYHSGGTIGWLGSYNIYGIFEGKDNNYLVPLKVFKNKNEAINQIILNQRL